MAVCHARFVSRLERDALGDVCCAAADRNVTMSTLNDALKVKS